MKHKNFEKRLKIAAEGTVTSQPAASQKKHFPLGVQTLFLSRADLK